MMLRRLIPLATIVVAACTDSTPAAPAPTLPPLPSAVWNVHTSDGQPVPALLGHRTLPGNVLEQDFLDSAKVEIDADGTWEHRGWYQRFRTSEHYAWGSTLDWGTWTATTTGYEFRRHTGQLLYTITGRVGEELRLNLLYPGQDGVAVSVLRQTPPPPTIVGRWVANALRDEPLPATYFLEPEFDTGNGIVSSHIVIDSAVVILYANERYLQRVFFSQWFGPANGPRQWKQISLMETDFGTWTKTGTLMHLASGWLQNKVITGEAAANLIGPLRLDHGITHGDEPAPFRYVRQ